MNQLELTRKSEIKVKVRGRDVCDACGMTHPSVETIGEAFRQREIRVGRVDPGRLCKYCCSTWKTLLYAPKKSMQSQ